MTMRFALEGAALAASVAAAVLAGCGPECQIVPDGLPPGSAVCRVPPGPRGVGPEDFPRPLPGDDEEIDCCTYVTSTATQTCVFLVCTRNRDCSQLQNRTCF